MPHAGLHPLHSRGAALLSLSRSYRGKDSRLYSYLPDLVRS
uniref:Uncharacterized protein n=1 Tax=Anguilla anguilla TaxID=7936 RepID=A0A0E9PU07_ANGAN